jgi:hypothetical protein
MTDSAYPQSDLPDSGMMTGSDAGDPGDRLDSLPLTDSERAVLETLRSASAARVESGEATVRAASDETTLPADTQPAGDDPLTPVFRPPAE